jgi:antitoxin (DNA-binding transcriptional repressor) of toxin-antitoxin stability system
LLEVRQTFDGPRVDDLVGATRRALEASGLLARINAGDSVAVGVGSRGIANIVTIARAAVDRLKEHGARPFIVAAMGSHGGATAEGQRELLAGMGITEASMGCELRITMEVKEIGRIPGGPALHQDIYSAAADHTILISRIKPHTDFRGKLESGPSKMEVIGLGKRHGAEMMHAWATEGFQRFLAPAARVYEANTNVRGAIAIIENACEETAEIVGLTADQIGTEVEERLLQKAKSLMMSLPFKSMDILVIREMGKNISGAGMDPNVIGKLEVNRQPEPEDRNDIGALVLLDLTEATHGNASGIGLANVTTARVVRKIDFIATYTNAITATTFGLKRSVIPITMADDRRALEVAVRCCGAPPDREPTFVFARNTLAVEHLWMSPNLRPQIEAHPRLTILGETPLAFDECGCMVSPWRMEP